MSGVMGHTCETLRSIAAIKHRVSLRFSLSLSRFELPLFLMKYSCVTRALTLIFHFIFPMFNSRIDLR